MRKACGAILAAVLVSCAAAAQRADRDRNREDTRGTRFEDLDFDFNFDFDMDVDALHDTMREAIAAAREAVASAREGMEAAAIAAHAAHESVGPAIRAALAQTEPMMLARSERGDARPVDERRDAAGVSEVRVENVSGSVVVRGWDDNTIHVQGTLGEDVEELVFDTSGSTADVRVKISKDRHKKIRTDLTIYIPKRCGLVVKAVSASVDAQGVEGSPVELRSISGDVDVRSCPGDLRLKSTSGDVTVDDARRDVDSGTISGDIEIAGSPRSVIAETISGHVTIDGVQSSAEIETISGDATVRGGRLSNIDFESTSGTLEYVGGLADDGNVDSSTLSGNVTLTLSEKVSGSFRLKTFSGNIDIPFAPEAERSFRGFRSKRLDFRLGDGDAKFDLDSFSGDFRIEMP